MKDLKLTVSGDFVIDPITGDFATTSTEDEAIVQDIMFRMKTTKGDYLVSPDVGVDLEKFIGMPNSFETYDRISEAVEAEIGKVPGVTNLKVYLAPNGLTGAYILVNYSSASQPGENRKLTFDLDLMTGTVEPRQ